MRQRMLCGEQIGVSPPAMFGVNALCTVPYSPGRSTVGFLPPLNCIAEHAGRGGRHNERSKITGIGTDAL